MAVDAELLQIFRDETNERLDRIVTTLLATEAGEAADDALDSLFRDAHSIKGNAGMVGFDEAQQIAHAMEDVLEQCRSAGALAPALAPVLLSATDAVREAIDGRTGVAEQALSALRGAWAGVGPQSPAPAHPVAPGQNVFARTNSGSSRAGARASARARAGAPTGRQRRPAAGPAPAPRATPRRAALGRRSRMSARCAWARPRSTVCWMSSGRPCCTGDVWIT